VAVFSTPASTPTTASERIWKKAAVGQNNAIITFYGGPGNNTCIRYQLDTANSTPAEKCTTASNLVAVQGVVTDSAGKQYTIITGRILNNQITAVSLEISGGSNTPAEVDDGGFVVVLPLKQQAIRAVPIDQYGNLVGQIFAFG
jgi:hypothetical protein